MKILKNKLVILFFIIIGVLFGTQFYFISNSFQRDTQSYVTLLKGQGRVNTNLLILNEKQKIIEGDVISTIGEESLAVIEWGDKSITRLGGNSRIEIKENFIGADLEKINISFELLRGKTWTNVLTIMGENSYFKQTIKENVAAVRGTVYEVDYEKDFIFIHNHEVELSTGDTTDIILSQGQLFSFTQFDFLTNIFDFRDQAWEDLNKKLDAQYLEELRKEFLQILYQNNPINFVKYFSPDYKIQSLLQENNPLKIQTYIQSLPSRQQEQVLERIRNIHQSLQFESGENTFLYNIKQNSRNVILEHGYDTEKALYLRYVLYDVNDMIQKGLESEIIEKNIELLQNHNDFIQKYGTNHVFGFESETLKEILFSSDPQKIFLDMKNSLKNLEQRGQEFLHNQLNNLFKK